MPCWPSPRTGAAPRRGDPGAQVPGLLKGVIFGPNGWAMSREAIADEYDTCAPAGREEGSMMRSVDTRLDGESLVV
jgi:hypothetical protein